VIELVPAALVIELLPPAGACTLRFSAVWSTVNLIASAAALREGQGQGLLISPDGVRALFGGIVGHP
jgi:hypothetical protein